MYLLSEFSVFVCLSLRDRRSQDFLWDVQFFPKKLMTFLVVALNTHARTLTLTTPTVQTYPAQQKFPKNDFCLRLGVHLQLAHINYAKIFFLTLGEGAHLHPLHPLATPILFAQTKLLWPLIGNWCSFIVLQWTQAVVKFWWDLTLTFDLGNCFRIFFDKKTADSNWKLLVRFWPEFTRNTSQFVL